MKESEKRDRRVTRIGDIQDANRRWWTSNPMAYAWNERIGHERFSREWFDEIDARFVYGSRLFAHGKAPFDRVIPLESLAGKRVLEIGCGMGLHSELMARAGARLTSVDISETSIAATRRRFELKGLEGDIRQMDARTLDFPDDEFDFVWTWGVIHHSAQTGVIVREIHRVLKPGGQMRAMVYNLDGFPAYRKMMGSFALGFWWGRTLDECLWASTDGYMARHYTVDGWQDLLATFFDVESVVTLGQDSDAVGLPRGLRHLVMKFYSPETLARKGNARGAFLFSIADKAPSTRVP